MPKLDFSKEAKETNKKFATETARLTKLSEEDINNIFPRKIDKERLVELMEIVRSAASRNKRAAQLERNISNLSGSVMRLLDLVT